MSIYIYRDRNLGIFHRHIRGERTFRQEADDQGLSFQRIFTIVESMKRQLLQDLKRIDVERQEVLEYYRITDDEATAIQFEHVPT